jgi:hypothetical protein
LSVLPGLKRIAFTRDSYEHATCLGVTSTPEEYYSERYPSKGELEAAGLGMFAPQEAKDQVWENGLRGCMVLGAEHYIESLPKLEWMYLGQYPIVMDDKNGRRARLPYIMFGWDGV